MNPGESSGVGTMCIADNVASSEVGKSVQVQHAHINQTGYHTDLICDERESQTIPGPGLRWLEGMFSKG